MHFVRVVAVVGLVALPAEAGLGSLFTKLARGGKAAKAASNTARVARVTRTATAGVATAVVAERAAASISHLGAEGAHAGFLARGATGELLYASKASHGAPVVVDDLGKAVAATADGAHAKVLIDPSAAANTEALAKLPPDAELVLVRGNEHLPVRRVQKENGVIDFVVDVGGNVVDLAEFGTEAVETFSDEPSSDDDGPGATLLAVAIAVVVIGVWKWKSS